MRTSRDSHFKSTTKCIPASLKCLFIVKDAKLSVTGLLSIIRSLATGTQCATAGLEIVEERKHPPMQFLHEGSYSRKPLC